MNEIFDALIAAALSPENAQLLRWEKYWYCAEATDTRHADDVKRETIPLKLSSTPEEIAAISKALKGSEAGVHASEAELEITFPVRSRQPGCITFSLKKFTWIPALLTVEDSYLIVSPEATLKDLLQTAMLIARYPQLSVKNPGTFASPRSALDFAQAQKRHVFKNIILSRRPSKALRFLDALGLLDIYLPEVTAGRNLTQNRFHAHDIFEHLLHAVDGAYDNNEPVRWSALLHDVGKVPTRLEGADGEATFHNHEMYSARMVVPIMKRLAVPIQVGQKVKFLVRNHMFHYTDEWSDKAVRRFVKKVPLEELQDLISLRLADRKGSGKKTAFPKALQNLIKHIDEIIEQERAFKVKDLALDGHVLMEMGMPQSRAMGDMLKHLFEEVKAGRAENTREFLEKLVKERLAAGAL